MVYEHLIYCKVLELDGDEYWIILLLIDAMEIGVGEYGGHATSMMGIGDVVDGLDVTKVFLSS